MSTAVQGTARGETEHADRPLRAGEWRTLAILGLPTFALALAITTVTTYLPVVASSFAASTVVIGVLIGGEGLLALGLPIVVGAWSDRLRTRIGGRLPLVLRATPPPLAGRPPPFVPGPPPPLVAALVLVGFVTSIATAAMAVAAFFLAYY